MRKFTFSFKSLLLAAGLLMGSANAWADDYSAVYTKTLTGETAWTTSDLTAWGVADNDKFSVNETNGLTLSVNGYSYNASYTESSIATTSKIKFVVEWYVGYLVANNSNNTTNNTYLMFGDKLRLSYDRGYNVYWSTDGTFIRDAEHKVSDNNARDKTVTVTLIYDPIKRTFESFVTSGINSYENNLTSTINNALIKEDIDLRKVTFGYYRTGNNNDITTSIKSITISECTQDVPAGHRYTINSVDGSGNIIKSLKSDYAENGATVSVSNLNLALYKSGKYYELDDAGVTSYAKSFTMVDEEVTFNVTYKEAADILYFKEGESIPNNAGSTSQVGASGGAYTSYFPASKTTDVATLDKGVYRAETYIWARTNQHINLYNTSKDDANILAHLTGSGLQSQIFAIDTDNISTVLSCTNNSCCFDYLLIRKIADYEVELTSSENLQGWKTFYNSVSNYQVDANTTIYKAAAPSANASTITLTPVEGNIIPKQTPVVLKTSDDVSYEMTLTATTTASEDDFTGNALTYKAEEGTVSNAYVLGYLSGEGNGLGFYPYTASLPAGTIYVTVPTAAKALRIVVDGEATGIEAPAIVETEEDEVLYNTAGQIVGKDYKGIVINQKGQKRFNK